MLATKLDKLAGSLEIKGRIGDRPWSVTLPLANAAEGAGLSKVWARRKIADAEIARTLRQASPEEADKTILALALEHQLVTRLTSLVAVDKTPSRPDGEPLKVTDLPLNLPAGWDFEKVFGPRSASRARRIRSMLRWSGARMRRTRRCSWRRRTSRGRKAMLKRPRDRAGRPGAEP